uniref:Virus-cell attachment protein sigma C n=1 Tax=Avian orthoreovirus TaxID=38170 RepID=A0A0E3VJA1_9REOV|nr:virus-cell attachment protein sigma C [Avian orthoreovirus]
MSLTVQQRREVVALILSLSQSSGGAPNDLESVYSRLAALEDGLAHANDSVASISDAVSSVAVDLRDVITSLADVSATVTSLSLSITSLTSTSKDLAERVSSITTRLQELENTTASQSLTLSELTKDVANLKTDVSRHGLSLDDLTRRVVALESAGGGELTFDAPLVLTDGKVTLDMSPYFCSATPNLSSYSTPAQLLLLQWLVSSTSGASSSTATFNVNVHVHGTRCDVIASTIQSLTVSDRDVTLSFSLTRIINPPSDVSRLVPSSAFQAASFPVDVSYTRNGTASSWHVYGSFSDAQTFRVTFSTGGSGTANLTYVTLRYGFDT